MFNDAIEKYYICDNSVCTVDAICKEAVTGLSIYEVIRVIDGVPLFYEMHFERLVSSAAAVGFEIKGMLDEMKQNLNKLIAINNNPYKNVKILVYQQDERCKYIMYFIKSSYPTAEQYSNGIWAITFHAVRNNPNAKVINLSLREQVEAEMKKHQAYEALLVNSRNQITEGSRSNAFFIKNSIVHTAPASQVLIGITRILVLELCRRLDIAVIEEPVELSSLSHCDALFMTGTSPKILPISKVDGQEFPAAQDATLRRLMAAYDELIQQYILDYKQEAGTK